MNRLDELLRLNNVEQPKKIEIIVITREDFEMLDVEQDVIYHIYEEDGTITIKKGKNE